MGLCGEVAGTEEEADGGRGVAAAAAGAALGTSHTENLDSLQDKDGLVPRPEQCERHCGVRYPDKRDQKASLDFLASASKKIQGICSPET